MLHRFITIEAEILGEFESLDFDPQKKRTTTTAKVKPKKVKVESAVNQKKERPSVLRRKYSPHHHTHHNKTRAILTISTNLTKPMTEDDDEVEQSPPKRVRTHDNNNNVDGPITSIASPVQPSSASSSSQSLSTNTAKTLPLEEEDEEESKDEGDDQDEGNFDNSDVFSTQGFFDPHQVTPTATADEADMMTLDGNQDSDENEDEKGSTAATEVGSFTVEEVFMHEFSSRTPPADPLMTMMFCTPHAKAPRPATSARLHTQEDHDWLVRNTKPQLR